MKPPHFSSSDVGTYWLRQDGSVWRLISYCDQPTVEWEFVGGPPRLSAHPGERIGAAVGSLITKEFTRLIREDQE
jgi:hypothetical protein